MPGRSRVPKCAAYGEIRAWPFIIRGPPYRYCTVVEMLEETLAEALRRLTPQRGEELVEESILGSDINQIRHLFYWLRSESRPVQVSYGSEEYKARVFEVTNTAAHMRVPGFQMERARRCRIKFEIVNILYQFEVPILDIGPETLTIRIPAYIQSAKRRKNRRIWVDDMYMRWIIVYQPLFGKRGTGQILEARYPHLVAEIKRDEPDLYLINHIITEELVKIAPNFEIKFYQREQPRNLMESIISSEKKTFYLQDVGTIETYYKMQRTFGLINYNREYRQLVRDGSEEDASKKFEAMQQADMQNHLANYVCAPLMIFDEVIGHIYIYTSVFDRGSITADQALQVDMLAQLMNYAMSKTVLARSYFRHTFTRVVNVSMGGLLFELNNRTTFDYLTYHDHLKMEIQIRHHLLKLAGEITRFYPTREGYNLGVQFYEAGPDDYRVLQSFVYERSRLMFE